MNDKVFKFNVALAFDGGRVVRDKKIIGGYNSINLGVCAVEIAKRSNYVIGYSIGNNKELLAFDEVSSRPIFRMYVIAINAITPYSFQIDGIEETPTPQGLRLTFQRVYLTQPQETKDEP